MSEEVVIAQMGIRARSKTTPLSVIRRGVDAEERWLVVHGFDGLACLTMPCGCWLGDLYPCGQRGGKFECVAGYASTDPDSDGGIYRHHFAAPEAIR